MSVGHKVAILLPNEWRAGMLRNASALAALLAQTNWPGLGTLDVVVGLLRSGPYDWSAVGQEFAALGSVSVRRMGWEAWPVTAIRTMLSTLPALPNAITHCSVPRDYGHDFLDCDAWIVFGSSLEGFVVPARPIAIYCADMIQRYVPQIFGAAGQEEHWRRQIATHLGWRSASCVFCTTPQTRTDAISYAGVRASRALLAPTLVDPIAGSLRPQQPAAKCDPYILWITNASAHKNHRAAMEALRLYYGELGGTLPVVVAGQDTKLLAPGSGAQLQSSRSVHEATDVLPHLRFVGEVTHIAYLRLVSEASVVWHNVVIDNGTFVAFDAARAGRHFVSSDYPQMRYLCERYGVAARWHKAAEPAAAAGALLAAERAAAAGQDPGHKLHQDSADERRAAYGAMLLRLFGNDGA